MFQSAKKMLGAQVWSAKAVQKHGNIKTLLFNLAALVVFLLVSVSCSFAFPNQPSEEKARPGEVLFADDFSKPPSGWGIWNRDGAAVEYHNGGLRILVNETQYDFWSVAGRSYRDAQIEVDVTKIGGPDDNDFGLICRYQDKSNFYMLVTSSDGYYGIAKMKGGQYSMIGGEQLQYSELIASGQSANHLRADCRGSSLR